MNATRFRTSTEIFSRKLFSGECRRVRIDTATALTAAVANCELQRDGPSDRQNWRHVKRAVGASAIEARDRSGGDSLDRRAIGALNRSHSGGW